MTSALSKRERRALATLLALGVAGHLIRAIAAEPGAAPIAAMIVDSAGDKDPLAHRDSIRALARPLGDSERIDVNRASAEELERLPGVGPALAKRIVALRESRGPFPAVAALAEVRGIGPALLARLGPHLSFAGVPAEAERAAGPPGAAAVDLNHASAQQLDSLPGIGPAKARAIVAFRDSAGPFRDVTDLRRVPGISAVLVARLGGRVTIH